MKIKNMDSPKIEFLEQNQEPKKWFETIYFILPIVFFFVSQIFARFFLILLQKAFHWLVYGFSWVYYLISYYYGFIFLSLAFISVFISKWAYEWIHKNDNNENLKSKKIRFVVFSCSAFLLLVLFGGAYIFNFIKLKNYQTIFSKKMPAVSAETKSWKTYRNADYDMELNYPKSWTFIDNGETIDFIPMDYPLDKCSLLKNNAYLFHGKGIQLKKINKDKGIVDTSQGSSKTKYKGNGVEIIKFEREDSMGIYVAVIKVGENLFNVEADKESLNIFENIFPTIKNCAKGECSKNFDVAENDSCYYLEKYGSAEMQTGNLIKQIIREWYSNKKTYNGFMEDESNAQKIKQVLEKVKNEKGLEVEFYLKTTDSSFVLRVKAKENDKFFYCQDRFAYEKDMIYEDKKTGDSSFSLKTKEVGNNFIKISGNNFHENVNCLGVPLDKYVIAEQPAQADLIIKDIYFNFSSQLDVKFCNNSENFGIGDFSMKVSTDRKSDFTFQSVGVPEPNKCSDRVLAIEKLGINKGDVANISVVIDPETDKENNKMTKSIIFGKMQGGCFDTDGGKNYYTQGQTTILTKNEGSLDCCRESLAPGPCLSQSQHLIEGYCENGRPLREMYKCPKGCADGACVK